MDIAKVLGATCRAVKRFNAGESAHFKVDLTAIGN